MTDYEITKNAVQVTNPAIKDADRDLVVHILTLIIDKYCSDHYMTCRQKCDFVKDILHNFEELKENMRREI